MVELTGRSNNNHYINAGNEIPIDTKDIFGKYLVYMEGKQGTNKYQLNKRMKEENIWATENNTNDTNDIKQSSFNNRINFISNAKHR
jgi:hypothetical protein